MTAERWARIRKLFDEAQNQPAHVRESYVRDLCAYDWELFEEVCAMLRNAEDSGALLDLTQFGRTFVRPAALARVLSPGQLLTGRYRIVRSIGSGGMGEVYEAEDLDLNERIAVKTMRMEDADALARFKREIQLARTVTHPNVCRIFDLHRHHDPKSGTVITFLTMELVGGETLAEFLARRGVLAPSEAFPIIEQIAQAVAAAHRKGVIHRDLKAGNVILADNGAKAVVTDFGLANTRTQTTESTVTVVGTPAYMAPEQFEGKPATQAVDVYALGVLLFEMVTGRRPFEGSSPLAVALDKIRKEPPHAADAVPHLPAAWDEVILKCLDPKPERRFESVTDAVARLKQSLDHQPVIRLTRFQRRVAISALIALLLLAAGLTQYMRSVYEPPGEARRLYASGMRAQQLGTFWKAAQFYEQALQYDPLFVAARAALANVWISLDQFRKAKQELDRAVVSRPRWRRIADHEALLERAARARVNGVPAESASLTEKAAVMAPDQEKPDLLFATAAVRAQAGDTAGAMSAFFRLRNDPAWGCRANLAFAVLLYQEQPVAARGMLDQSVFCFENAGDLDGSAQTLYEFARLEYGKGGPSAAIVQMLRRALTVAQNSGNAEQEIVTGDLLSEVLLDSGDEEASYAMFSRSMQAADRHAMPLFGGRLLSSRADYYFRKGDYLQAASLNSLAAGVTKASGMSRTYASCMIREARASLRMQVPAQSLMALTAAERALGESADPALRAEIAALRAQADRSHSRPEGSLYSAKPPAGTN